MVFRAAGQIQQNKSNNVLRSRSKIVFTECSLCPTRRTVFSQSVAGRHSFCVGDDHRVSAQIILIRVGESQSGAEKQTGKPIIITLNTSFLLKD